MLVFVGNKPVLFFLHAAVMVLVSAFIRTTSFSPFQSPAAVSSQETPAAPKENGSPVSVFVEDIHHTDSNLCVCVLPLL